MTVSAEFWCRLWSWVRSLRAERSAQVMSKRWVEGQRATRPS
jgi:hypothetical protein